MTPSLKRETIKGILTENAFDMSNFGDVDRLRRMKQNVPTSTCGTAVCMAGHIVAAAARLGVPIPTFTEMANILTNREGAENCPYRTYEIGTAEIARELWARAYGTKKAARLDFYGERVPGLESCNWVDSDSEQSGELALVAVRHLRGEI